MVNSTVRLLPSTTVLAPSPGSVEAVEFTFLIVVALQGSAILIEIETLLLLKS